MNDCPRNFIVSYTGRVGSSAIIDVLSRLPAFVIPIFEELDWYYIQEHGLEDKHNAGNIHNIVDYLIRTVKEEFPNSSIGFKWRVFGDPLLVAATLQKHNVVVLNMIRSELLEVVSSLYLTDIVHKTFNETQFAFRDTQNPEVRENILTRYRLNPVSVDLNIFLELCDKFIEAERGRIALLTTLQNAGVEVHTIIYEDFAYRRVYLIGKLLSLLGHAPLSAYPISGLTKISSAYPYESFLNKDDILASPILFEKIRQWTEVVYSSGFHVVGT